ncbi:MAG: HdeA/HdeB family chaperone [Stellaceae bacterium]
MNAKTVVLLLSGFLAACVQTQPPAATAPAAPPPAQAAAPTPAQASPPAAAPAQAAAPVPTDHVVNIRRAGCQDLLRLSPDDRRAASMFYIGYQASRVRASSINVGLIPSIEAQAVTYCAENPNRTVADVFAEAFSSVRR